MTEKELRTIVALGIRRSRKSLGLTIEKLAEASSMDAGYLAHVETANKTPSLATLARILTALDISPAELFRVNQKTALPPPPKSIDRRLQASLRSLNSSQKKDLLAVIHSANSKKIKALRVLLET